ncbi:MAG TPA: 30S ribosomal protein S12 methylthiotransferase RimO [Phycisphaerales bacterium]|nr:30S ribosomal protein S12 methylthiotransferase RimO [Phycisphaerales bacterium]
MTTQTADLNVARVAFVSLGCPKNLVDSEKMLGTLAQSGVELVSEQAGADAVIINTCGFLEASKQESLDVIHDAIERKNRGELKRVVVAGCLVQRHRAKMLEWAPGIDAMIGVFDRDHILEAVNGAPAGERAASVADGGHLPPYWIAGNALQAAKARGMKTTGLTVNGADGKGVGYFEDDSTRFRLTPRHWAYLRVSEGCNQKCAFCTIPSIRGKMRSKPLDRIISEARQLMADGAFELNLIGQDTTSYGYDIYDSKPRQGAVKARVSADLPYSGDLIGLLTALNDVGREFGGPAGAWMRLMYVYPTYFTDEMIDAIAALPNIVKYIDIPLQHMSNRMLKAMRRNITRDQQAELLYKLRERIPGLAIRTTFITGFPGETEDDHEELMEFIDEFGFDMMGVFQYSREEGTPAGTMDLDPELHVPDDVKARREQELMLLQQEIAFENAKYVAEQKSMFDVLIEGPAAGGTTGRATTGVVNAGALYTGRCYHQAPQVDSLTYVHSEAKLSPGELVRCTIVDADGYDLIAQPTEQLDKRISLPLAR